MRRSGPVLLALSIIAAGTLGSSGRGYPSRVQWCLTCPPGWLADAISNIALFAPLGASLAFVGLSTARSAVLGGALSVGIELCQLWGLVPGRVPSLADFLTNSIGTGIGAMLVRRKASLFRPSAQAAAVLATIWTFLAPLIAIASGWLLSPELSRSPSTHAVAPSSLAFTPGYGWFAGRARGAVINGIEVSHIGSGPVIAQADRTSAIEAEVTISGRDARGSLVPIVFVHSAENQRPLLLLGEQKGTTPSCAPRCAPSALASTHLISYWLTYSHPI